LENEKKIQNELARASKKTELLELEKYLSCYSHNTFGLNENAYRNGINPELFTA
jgi:hypothetical protein